MILNYKNSLDALMTILSMGGKITQAPNRLSYMLNGLEYYSLEVSINGDHYLIQVVEQEAIDLLNAVVTMLDEKNLIKKLKKFSDNPSYNTIFQV
jgi:hypothetical protein